LKESEKSKKSLEKRYAYDDLDDQKSPRGHSIDEEKKSPREKDEKKSPRPSTDEKKSPREKDEKKSPRASTDEKKKSPRDKEEKQSPRSTIHDAEEKKMPEITYAVKRALSSKKEKKERKERKQAERESVIARFIEGNLPKVGPLGGPPKRVEESSSGEFAGFGKLNFEEHAKNADSGRVKVDETAPRR